jgi:hypothetical protein
LDKSQLQQQTRLMHPLMPPASAPPLLSDGSNFFNHSFFFLKGVSLDGVTLALFISFLSSRASVALIRRFFQKKHHEL